jgi:hypothetical protein
MPTKTLVPRASGEGGLGATDNAWGLAYYDTGNFNKGLFVSGKNIDEVIADAVTGGGLGGVWNAGAGGIIYYNGGNVGIGTTNPNTPLSVRGANNTTFDNISNVSFIGTDSFNSSNAGAGITFAGRYDSSGTETVFGQISAIKENATDGDYKGALTFGARDGTTVNMEAMRITSAGSVGIGTASPGAQLEVKGNNPKIDLVRSAVGGGVDGFELKSLGNNDANNPINPRSGLIELSTPSSGTSGATMIFSTKNDSTTHNTLALKDGKVGIGDTNPLKMLDINGTMRTRGIMRNVTNDDEAFSQIRSNDSTINLADNGYRTSLSIGASLGSSTSLSNNSGLYIGAYGAGSNATNNHVKSAIHLDNHFTAPKGVRIFTGTGSSQIEERMRITSAGNVGIGTTNPIFGLDVVDTSTMVLGGSDDGLGRTNDFIKSSRVGGIAYANADLPVNMMMHVSTATESRLNFGYGTGSMNFPTKIIFGTAASVNAISNNSANIRMVIEGNGNVGIGTSAPAKTLDVNGKATFGDGSDHAPNTPAMAIKGSANISGQLTVDANAFYIGQNDANRELRLWSGQFSVGVKLTNGSQSWGTFSDKNLKKDISDIGPVLDKISDIRCINFKLKTDEDSVKRIGFIAQDFVGKFDEIVEEPSSIDGSPDKYLGLKYAEVTPILMKAVQEQQALIEDLRSEVEALKNK